MGPIGCIETTVTTNLRCVASQKSVDLGLPFVTKIPLRLGFWSSLPPQWFLSRCFKPRHSRHEYRCFVSVSRYKWTNRTEGQMVWGRAVPTKSDFTSCLLHLRKKKTHRLSEKKKMYSVFQATTEPQIVRKTSRRQVECWRSFFAVVKMF
jgi:hypothetical protein